MTLVGAVLVTVTVWAVSLIGPVRLRALVYGLPVPMSLVLSGTGQRVDGGQIIGVLLLVAFFATVAVLHVRLAWPVLLADAAAVVGYIIFGWLLPARVPLWPAVTAVTALWAVGLVLAHRRPVAVPPGGAARDRTSTVDHDRAPVRRTGVRVALAKLAGVFAAALLMTVLAGPLAGLVVTFPYSGVLVAVEVRRDLVEFTRHFAVTAISLVGFLTGYAACQHRGTVVALAAGWGVFLVLAAASQLTRRRRGNHAGATGTDTVRVGPADAPR